MDVRVPVAFNQPLTIENRALLLAEVRRTTCGFMYLGVTIDRSCCNIMIFYDGTYYTPIALRLSDQQVSYVAIYEYNAQVGRRRTNTL